MAPAQPKGLWPPCQHDLFITSGPPPLAVSPSFSPLTPRGPPVPLRLVSTPPPPPPPPPTRVYFCQLPYSRLHSAFARAHKTFLVRADEAPAADCGHPW